MFCFMVQAYRVEPLINPSTSTLKPVLVPHYKGRKRLHLGEWVCHTALACFVTE